MLLLQYERTYNITCVCESEYYVMVPNNIRIYRIIRRTQHFRTYHCPLCGYTTPSRVTLKEKKNQQNYTDGFFVNTHFDFLVWVEML